MRVIPRHTHAVDVVVSGRILHSNGESMELEATVTDATGTEWFTREYTALASKYAYEPNIPPSFDAFQAIYKSLANDMLAYREQLSEDDVRRIRRTAELKFAREFSTEAFADHVQEVEPGKFEIARLPADNDPMLERVRKVREREYLFIDTLDEYYANYHRQMYPVYQEWRRASYEQAIAYNELKAQAKARAIGGTMAIVGGVAGIYKSDSAYVDASGVVGVIAGASLITSAVKKRHEAEQQADRLRELGSAAEAELVPTTIELENQTMRLQGSVDQQYDELRRILRRVYFEDLGLDPPPGRIARSGCRRLSMTEPDQDIIQPQAAPLSHLHDEPGGRPANIDRRSLAVAGAVIGVLVLAWTLLPELPDAPEIAAERPQAVTTDGASDANRANAQQPPPFAQTQIQRAREKAQQELSAFVEKQIELEESMSAEIWGAEELAAALALAQAGDEAFVAERYDEALAGYQQAVAAMDELIRMGDAEFTQATDAVRQAIAQFDPEVARAELARARVIKPEHPDVALLTDRVAQLPDIIVQLRTARNHEFSGRYDQAIAIYDEIARLDPNTAGLAELRRAAAAAQSGEDLTALISQGFQALQNKRFDAARSAFNKALQLDPGNDIAAGGLQQVAEQHDLAVIEAHRRKAESALAGEDWQQAIDEYQAALALDANLQFALSGTELARAHLRAHTLLGRIVAAPQRLSNESLYLEAGNILQDAQNLDRAGPQLQDLIGQVDDLLVLYRDPVEVVLISDNNTDVIVSNVGRLGTFERKTLSLRPGQYTIRGSQNGCRDIFMSLDVLPGIDPIDVSCPERLTP